LFSRKFVNYSACLRKEFVQNISGIGTSGFRLSAFLYFGGQNPEDESVISRIHFYQEIGQI